MPTDILLGSDDSVLLVGESAVKVIPDPGSGTQTPTTGGAGLMAVRLGDANGAGGTIVSTLQSTVFINGILASTLGSGVSPHINCPDDLRHCAATVSTGSVTVFIGGIPAVRITDSDSCGHQRVIGSPNVFIG